MCCLLLGVGMPSNSGSRKAQQPCCSEFQPPAGRENRLLQEKTCPTEAFTRNFTWDVLNLEDRSVCWDSSSGFLVVEKLAANQRSKSSVVPLKTHPAWLFFKSAGCSCSKRVLNEPWYFYHMCSDEEILQRAKQTRNESWYVLHLAEVLNVTVLHASSMGTYWIQMSCSV